MRFEIYFGRLVIVYNIKYWTKYSQKRRRIIKMEDVSYFFFTLKTCSTFNDICKSDIRINKDELINCQVNIVHQRRLINYIWLDCKLEPIRSWKTKIWSWKVICDMILCLDWMFRYEKSLLISYWKLKHRKLNILTVK